MREPVTDTGRSVGKVGDRRGYPGQATINSIHITKYSWTHVYYSITQHGVRSPVTNVELLGYARKRILYTAVRKEGQDEQGRVTERNWRESAFPPTGERCGAHQGQGRIVALTPSGDTFGGTTRCRGSCHSSSGISVGLWRC